LIVVMYEPLYWLVLEFCLSYFSKNLCSVKFVTVVINIDVIEVPLQWPPQPTVAATASSNRSKNLQLQ